MKTPFILLFLSFFSVSASSYSQNARVSIHITNKTIGDVFDKIQEQTSYSFWFESKDVDIDKKVTLDVKNETVEKVLMKILDGQNVSFHLEDSHILITKKDSKNTDPGKSPFVPQQQKNSIKGTIIDEKGEPVIGASIRAKDTNIGTVSGIDGSFTIDVLPPNILIISYLGFITQEITIHNQQALTIILKENLKELDEIVVVAYGTQKKVNLTGAVSSIGGDVLENRAASNATNLLTGQIPGVTIVQNSGQPGADVGSLRVRGIGTLGNSEAMVIVDGVESTISSVNPNDIESISVLKDAAASSIYGVRAANGVILVTTKRGTTGRPVISYSSSVGWQSASNMPKYLGSADYAMLLNEAYSNDGLAKPYSDQDIENFRKGNDPDYYPNTNWVDRLLSENGLFHNHFLSMVGGSEYVKYSVSLGYHEKEGLTPNTSYNKYNIRANLDTKINDRLNVNLNIAAYRDRREEPATGLATIFLRNFREAPTSVLQFSNGNYGLYLNEHNSVSEARSGGTQKEYKNNFQGNISATYKILDGLTWHGSASSIFELKENYSFKKSIKYYTADSDFPVKTTRSGVFNQDDKMLEINLQTYLNYEKSFGVHGIKGLAGYSQIQNQNRTLYASRQDMPNSNMLGEINAGDITTQQTNGNKVEYALRSVFGRINYNYNDRYLLEANIRYDGTSRFPKNKRFGTFPSFSVAWRISEENFFKVPVVDNLKIRASWGILGNQEIGNYAYLNTYAFGKNYTFGNLLVPGISINDKMANEHITWEKTKQLDIGLDTDLFNGKLGFTFDYFQKNTNDILLSLPIPALIGVTPPTQNAGKVKNTGVEFALRHNNIINGFRYYATFNMSYVKNEITDLKGTDYPGRSVGDPIYNIYGYVFDKIFESEEEIANSPKQLWGAVPGDLKYKDLNGDNVIDEKDRKSLASYFPKMNYGILLGAEYKNFDFSTLLQGTGNVSMLVQHEINKAFFNGGKVTEKHLDRWTPDNINASYPRLSLKNSTKNEHTSSYWVSKASYLRMKNIQFGYSIPKSFLGNSGISRLRLYFSADNLFTITQFEGIDPEAAGDISGNGNTYYPITKNYSFGVNISF